MELTKEELCRVRLFAMDFDGIHTTRAHVFVNQEGVESVRCSRIDSLGLSLIRKKAGIELRVISKETNPVVTARCNKLQIKCEQAVETGEGKLEILQRIIRELGISKEETLYMGDDLQDLPPLRFVGLPVTVPGGRPQVKAVCKYTTTAEGGDGAIREVCDMILEARGIDLTV